MMMSDYDDDDDAGGDDGDNDGDDDDDDAGNDDDDLLYDSCNNLRDTSQELPFSYALSAALQLITCNSLSLHMYIYK